MVLFLCWGGVVVYLSKTQSLRVFSYWFWLYLRVFIQSEKKTSSELRLQNKPRDSSPRSVNLNYPNFGEAAVQFQSLGYEVSQFHFLFHGHFRKLRQIVVANLVEPATDKTNEGLFLLSFLSFVYLQVLLRNGCHSTGRSEQNWEVSLGKTTKTGLETEKNRNQNFAF